MRLHSTLLALLLTLVFATIRCSVDGNETIPAGEAARILKGAMITTILRCHPIDSQPTNPLLAQFELSQPSCFAAYNKQLLVRQSDVEGCADQIRFMPCQPQRVMTAVLVSVFAANCPIQVVHFLINDVHHSFQGNIIQNGKSDPVFYFACM